MEQKNSLTIDINKQDHNDLVSFCKLNEITDVDGFVKLCFRKGLMIEKYGLLNQGKLPDIIEREFEKEVIVEDNSKIEELQNEIYILKGKLEDKKEVECGKLQETLFELNRQLSDKNNTIKELTRKVNELEDMTKTSYAFYLQNSNLKNRI
jgi:proteasome assembly chaperone (PAC2) family protein